MSHVFHDMYVGFSFSCLIWVHASDYRGTRSFTISFVNELFVLHSHQKLKDISSNIFQAKLNLQLPGHVGLSIAFTEGRGTF